MNLPEFSAASIDPGYTYIAEVRHGFSWGNFNKGIIQSSDLHSAGLHPTGEIQAGISGDKFLEQKILPRAALTSPLLRATQTAKIHLGIISPNVPAETEVRFREMCKGYPGLPGGMEGRRRETVETAEYWEAFRRDGWRHRHGSIESCGETAEEVGLRVIDALNDFADTLDGFDQLERPDGWGLIGVVYTHAQAIRYGLGPILGWPNIFSVLNKEYLIGNAEALVLARSRSERLWFVAGRISIGTVEGDPKQQIASE